MPLMTSVWREAFDLFTSTVVDLNETVATPRDGPEQSCLKRGKKAGKKSTFEIILFTCHQTRWSARNNHRVNRMARRYGQTSRHRRRGAEGTQLSGAARSNNARIKKRQKAVSKARQASLRHPHMNEGWHTMSQAHAIATRVDRLVGIVFLGVSLPLPPS
jgi:hypothetical protein